MRKVFENPGHAHWKYALPPPVPVLLRSHRRWQRMYGYNRRIQDDSIAGKSHAVEWLLPDPFHIALVVAQLSLRILFADRQKVSRTGCHKFRFPFPKQVQVRTVDDGDFLLHTTKVAKIKNTSGRVLGPTRCRPIFKPKQRP